MTRPSDIDAAAREAAGGSKLLRALVGLVVGALLLVVGLPRGADLPVPGDRPALSVAQGASHGAMAGIDRVLVADDAVAPGVAEPDEWAGRSACADPLSHRLPPLSDTGFHPRGRAVAAARETEPPYRPPRHA